MGKRTPVNQSEVDALKAAYPELPNAYFDYLLAVGAGEADSGRMIYSGPIVPSSVYGPRYQDSRIVLLGDDMQGYCFGFDRQSLQFGEISDFGEWQHWPSHRVFDDYVVDADDE
jgi:hypothetical protein